jgi:beta-lactamase regulating signal transducer with metallopeptidase domain
MLDMAWWDRPAGIWTGWMIQMSWQVLVLAIVVWVLTGLLRRSNAALRYALWGLVFIKLVLPPGLGAPWSVGAAVEQGFMGTVQWAAGLQERAKPAPSTAPVQSPVAVPPAGASPKNLAFLPEDVPDNRVAEAPVPSAVAAPRAAEPATVQPRPYARWAMLVWAFVATVLLMVLISQWQEHTKRVLRDSTAAPEELLVWVRTLASRFGLRADVEVRMSPALKVPCVCGLWRSVVVLPMDVTQRLHSSQQADLIAHELAHIKRCDLQTGWLASVLLCLYWFHPAVWLASLYLRREREMACDDKVLYVTRREGTEYASTMLRLAEGFDGSVPAGAGFLGLFEMADNLLQRVRSVADGTRSRRAGWKSVATVGLLALLLIPMGTWAQDPAPASDTAASMDKEIEQYYGKADDEVKRFMKAVATNPRVAGLWLPADAFKDLSGDAREAKVKETLTALDTQQGDAFYKALAEAGALGDPRFLPVLTNIAWDTRPGGQDNRAKWMAVFALGRLGDKKAVPVLIPLLDHYNMDTRMLSRASLVRLTGENFGADKQAWAKWANAQGPDTAISPAILEWASRQSQDKMNNPAAQAQAQAQRQGQGQEAQAKQAELVAAADKEIAEHYAAAAPEVKEYIRWTARQFGMGQMWLPEGSLDSLTPEQREEKVKYLSELLNGEYGRHMCQGLAEAGALKDPRLLAGLKKVAGYQRDGNNYDCRPKWIAVASLARYEDPSSAPMLVDLVDFGNQNVKMWARAAMSRLTGQNLGEDKKAWAEWWNANGKEPKIDVSQLKPWTPPASAGAAAGPAPQIVSTEPAFNAKEVDPSVAVLRVTFDQDMAQSFSWTGGPPAFPETAGAPRWVDKRTCELPVKLEAGRVYRVGFNSKSHQNFKSEAGVPTPPKVLAFATKGAKPEDLEALNPPKVVSMAPEAGAKDVDPKLDKLTVTFDRPMGGGFSWTGSGEAYPESTDKPAWSEDGKTCTMPVRLKPNWNYRLGLNSPSHINFQSEAGVPLQPVEWTFTTGAER